MSRRSFERLEFNVSLFFKEGIVKKVVRILPIFWLVLWCAFGIYSYYGYTLLLDAKSNAKQMTHQVQKKEDTEKGIKEKNKQANFDPNSITPATPERYADAQINYEKIVNLWGIGSVYIPSSNIRTKILAGMDDQNLMVGVGTYYLDQKLGKGNYVVLAHNIVQGGGALGNLPNTTLNQVFYATDFTNVYEYVAIKNGIFEETAGDLLDLPETDNKAVMTLIRCEGNINTTKRAVVQGLFLKSYPADQADHAVKEGLGLEQAVETVNEQSNPGSMKDSSLNESQSNKDRLFKTKEPIYSIFDQGAIYSFKLLKSESVKLGIVFIVGTIALVGIRRKIYV